MAKPVVLLIPGKFYKPGWIETHWPKLVGEAEFVLSQNQPGPDLIAEVARADIIYARGFPVTRDLMAAAPRLLGVVTSGVGVDKVDVDAATHLGIPVANSPGNTVTMAESTMLLVAAFAKRLFFWVDLARRGVAPDSATQGREMRGQTIGLVGYGRIGRMVARLATGYGMVPIAHDPFVEGDGVAEMVGLDELYARSDFVSLHPLLTAETHHMINAESIGKMKRGVYFLNTARGGLVDEAALLAALRSGHIAGAGLDVFNIEPPAPDNPLVKLANVIPTPHGLGQAEESRLRCAELSQENMLALIAGRLPDYTVNPNVAWRFRR